MGLSPKQDGRDRGFATLRLAFVGLIAVIALLEITGESLGLLHGVEELIPAPLALLAVALGGSPIFRRAFFNGIARLSGTVASRQAKRRAEDLADQIWGVRDVQNHLSIAGLQAT